MIKEGGWALDCKQTAMSISYCSCTDQVNDCPERQAANKTDLEGGRALVQDCPP